VQNDVVGPLCGIAGPTAFVGAWLVGGVLADRYDPLADAISRLAEEGAPTAPLMTAGFIAFGVLLPVWARTLGELLRSSVLRAVVTTAGVATLGVAVFPLTPEGGGTTQDVLHAVAAGLGYAAMAATPFVAAPALRRRGQARAALASIAVGAVSASALVASIAVEDGGGLQRLGLTVVDAWHVVCATSVLAVIRRRSGRQVLR
jgi:hypothetical membrane protein